MTLKIRTTSRNLKVLLNLMYNTLWCIYVAAVTYFKCIPRNYDQCTLRWRGEREERETINDL
jgi:hypothetical protein